MKLRDISMEDLPLYEALLTDPQVMGLREVDVEYMGRVLRTNDWVLDLRDDRSRERLIERS